MKAKEEAGVISCWTVGTGWVLGPEKVPIGRADFTTGRERGKKRPRDH